VVLAAASLVGVLAGCSAAGPGADLDVPNLPVAPTSTSNGSVHVVLRFGDETTTATLADTSAARDFAALLPLELDLRDPMGQAKSGTLPRPLDVSAAEAVSNPAAGQMYYSAPSSTFAVFYTDLGQSIPDPGLVPLGTVDTDLDRLADAGNRFTVRIDLAGGPTF
jgi:hypothetical protein